MSNKGPISTRRRRSESVAANDAPVAATESRLDKVKNAVKNHPFIAGGVAGTIGLLALDLATTTAKMTMGDYAQAAIIAAAEVATLEGIGYGVYRLAKAAYNNANMESVKNAGKTALEYASKPFSFGLSTLKAGYNMLPSFKRTAVAANVAAPVVHNDVVEPTVRRSSRIANRNK